ncbi:asparagine synthase-related protein [Halorubrum ezzemoulense]|uniref:asparagine synthase-related protein n=1 Tax=Halorubrum ezzemoulense TaxID=337243 RepID=UPI00232D98F2|nr:asparagine synthase-related protein [Halorubrum ezzemoulense]MDB9252932.1 asparagine synthase-related protein [Halorubrum ezzemoulense]MDB9256684.1 asparagine synthase-related protein [Halorubrum ezzemoulense]MDB9278251.1 asparagine synthase-related protein [Halorubrum ezzemoulense]
MPGICGIVGKKQTQSPSTDVISFDNTHEESYSGDLFSISSITHNRNSQPVESDDGSLIWIWGDIYSHKSDSGEYIPKRKSHPDTTQAEYCVKLFEELGLSFIERLNNEFAIVIYDNEEGMVHLAVDRLGSRPFYMYENGDSVLFSTSLQSLSLHPMLNCDFDTKNLQSYFGLKYVPGTNTPIQNVKQIPPATMYSFDLSEHDSTFQSYWEPNYNPVHKPKSYFVNKMTEYLSKALDERFSDKDDIGLMLSGGSDSRLLAGLSNKPIKCYFLNEWKNSEYQIASKVAAITGNEFEFLQRSEDYHLNVLEKNAPLHDFVSEFHQAHAGGFRDVLSDEVDVLLHGMYGDTFFKGYFLQQKSVTTPIGQLVLPFFDDVDTISQYLEAIDPLETSYLNIEADLLDVLQTQIVSKEGSLEYAGVEYGDLRTLVFADNWYPLTNQPDYLFHSNLTQLNNIHTPFIDNRLIDLHLSIPLKYQMRGRLVSEGVVNTSARLAELAHPDTGVRLDDSFTVSYLKKNAKALREKYCGQNRTYPKPYYTDSAWCDARELIRETSFVEDKLKEHGDELEELEFFDKSAVYELYDAHLKGEDNHRELYRILSILEMPVTSCTLNNREK